MAGAQGARRPPRRARRRAPCVTDYSASIISGGLTRTYQVHLPPAASAGRPLALLLALHGRLGDGQGQAMLTGFNSVADTYGFIVVYPGGYERSWADGRGTTPADKADVDDVAFLGPCSIR